MATLYELFQKLALNTLRIHENWPLVLDGENFVEVVARVHLDYDASGKYVSFYIPPHQLEKIELAALQEVDRALAIGTKGMLVEQSFAGEFARSNDLKFTGRVFLYTENELPPASISELTDYANSAGLALVGRSSEFRAEQSKLEKPRAFISHDSRDKKEIAEPLALELLRQACSVWYDEFTLKVGDSLRESIEKGLKDCERCILVLTPNFLANGGWAKREYDSIFTREIIERDRRILPVWSDVTPNGVFEYSPILADRLGVPWSLGCEEVARRLIRSM